MTTELRAVALAFASIAVAAGSVRADEGARTFAGSIQLDYLAVPSDRQSRQTTLDGATAELSLKLTKDFSKNYSAQVKVCFACHGFEIGAAFVEMRAADELRVRVGRITPSFGSFPFRHDPANHLTSDKPLPYDMGRMIRRNDLGDGILPAPWVDSGVEIGGTWFWEGGHVDYAVFAIGGPKGGPDAIDFDFTESRSPSTYYIDNNSQPSIGARASLSLDVGDNGSVVLGASGMTGHYDPARKLGFVIVGADAVLQLGKLYLRAEWLIRRTRMALGDSPATKFKFGPSADGQFDNFFIKDGFYTEAEVPLDGFWVIARWDGLRRYGNVLAASELSRYTYVLRYTAGVAVKLAASIRLKASVEYYDFRDFSNEIGIHLGVATPF